ncbi:MAG: response regulator [Flavobacterium sp. BFFFF1]|uniref:response regulator n=1 Tax=Flavobacterium sp. BFFFF1 TaxID=2015557 RepID=UPI000BC3DA30|nr:response regulator [Flavobacterium sp. BFFFF1]OYU81773.1 MAG: response regulator [Flavobacterium sp. BFFFF1]
MNKRGPIIFIEDDTDDQEVIAEVYAELDCTNEIIFFSEAEKALEFLTETKIKPFIIFSDINMPRLSGLELRDKVRENKALEIKSIPYLFFTTSAEQQYVIDAYSKSIQGFFVKPSNYTELKKVLTVIINYWQHCVSPEYTG